MIILTRQPETSTCTPGIVDIDGRTFPTIEQPDRNNEPFKSCIPLGDYKLMPYRSKKYGRVYVAVNPDLNVYFSHVSVGRPDDGRFKCLYFHRGSYGRNFKGCGGVGKQWLPEQEMITNTRETCKVVNSLIEAEGSFELSIRSWWE